MHAKAIKYISIVALFFFPFVITKSLAFSLGFPHVMFMFATVEVLILLFLLDALRKREFVIKKSKIITALCLYIAILFITAITGFDFNYSFWGNYTRMTGIITWLHYGSFFVILSAVFSSKKEWSHIFRALALSGALLGALSFLGRDGIGLSTLSLFRQGGSFLGNTSYAGAYELLIFFFSIIGLSLDKSKIWRRVYVVSMALIALSPEFLNFNIWIGKVSLSQAIQSPELFLGVARSSTLVLWAGILASLVLFLVHRLKDKKQAIKIVIVLMVILFSVYGYGFAQLMGSDNPIHNYYESQIDPVRPIVWGMAIKGIKERPLLGYGDGNFKYVYQSHLDTEMIHLEDPPWFDRAHNFIFDEIIGHGIIGALILLAIFILVIIDSLKFYYQKKREFYFLLIPLIFFLHFLQMQTFFSVDSTLLLSFVLLAFLLSHEKDRTIKIPKIQNSAIYKAILGILLLVALNFFIFSPIKENRILILAREAHSREDRLETIRRIEDVKIDQYQVLWQLAVKFETDTATHAREIQTAGLVANVAEEYGVYLDLFEKAYPKYQDHYRFLIEYANFINSAYIFGVDELELGEKIAKEALEISEGYPQPLWVLSINSYYKGNTEEARLYTQRAIDLDPRIRTTIRVAEFLAKHISSPNDEKAFLYLDSF